MTERPVTPSPGHLARVDLRTYSADLQLATLTLGVDNIHYDVFLSPRFVESTRAYLLDLIRQTANLTQFASMEPRPKTPETGTWKKYLTELLQASLTRAKYVKNIELDLLGVGRLVNDVDRGFDHGRQ